MAESKSKIKDQRSKIKKNDVVEAKAASTKTVKKAGALSAEVFDMTGKKAGSVSLPSEIFAAKVNKNLIAQAVRVYLANQRSGTASTKTRGEVNKTTAKAWRQKGTGRARHGAKSAPIFVGGGVALGPHPHDFSMKLPKKMRKAALFSALSAKLKDGEIKIVSGLETIEPKTRIMAGLLKNLSLDGAKRNVLLVMSDKNDSITKASRNLKGLTFTRATQVNTYEVLTSSVIVFMKESIDILQKHFLKK